MYYAINKLLMMYVLRSNVIVVIVVELETLIFLPIHKQPKMPLKQSKKGLFAPELRLYNCRALLTMCSKATTEC